MDDLDALLAGLEGAGSAPPPKPAATSTAADVDRLLADLDGQAKVTPRNAAAGLDDVIAGATAGLDRLGGMAPAEHTCATCSREVDGEKVKANNRVYHPWCFYCHGCGEKLGDNYLEHENFPWCVPCYQGKFANVCGGCSQAVIGEVLTAMDKSWHPACFHCAQCKQAFADGRFVPYNGKPYCERDHASLFGDKCCQCGQPGPDTEAMGRKWHERCFACSVCSVKLLLTEQFYTIGDSPACKNCYNSHTGSGSMCAGCHRPITTGTLVDTLDKKYHGECLKCVRCSVLLDPSGFSVKDNQPWCGKC